MNRKEAQQNLVSLYANNSRRLSSITKLNNHVMCMVCGYIDQGKNFNSPTGADDYTTLCPNCFNQDDLKVFDIDDE